MKAIYKLLFACLVVLAVAAPSHAVIVEFNGCLVNTFYDWEKDGHKGGISVFDAYEFYLLGRVDVAQDVMANFEVRFEHVDEWVELRQGYIKWSIAEPMSLVMGRFYMPIGRYGLRYYGTQRKVVSEPYPMRMVVVTPCQDTGIMLKGQVDRFGYAVAVVNGLGEEYIGDIKPRNAGQRTDNNDYKTVGGRLSYSPVDELEVGVSYMNGKYDDAGEKNLQVADVDLLVEVKDFSLEGEWAQSISDDLETDDEITTSGFYVQASYKLLRDQHGINFIEPVVRYESIDPGREMVDRFSLGPESTGRVTGVSAGLGVSPREHFLIKAEYRITTEEIDPQLSNNAVYVQFCADF